MRVAELHEPRRFRVVDAPKPRPGPGEVLARVKAVGICGSDMHWYSDGGIGSSLTRYPAVLGHEPTGIIERTGAGVTGWSKGDRVALEPAIYCYHCESCLTGRHNTCQNGRFLSAPGEPGYLREWVALPAANLLPLPVELGFREGTLFEPLAVILSALEFCALRPGETAMVYGAGPIGLLTVRMLKLVGAGRVWCAEPVPGRRALALEMGADAVFDPTQTDPVSDLLRDTGGRGVDVTFDCATQDDTINQSLYSTRPAGRVILIGIYTGLRVSVDLHAMRSREITLHYVHRSKHHNGRPAIDFLRQHARLFAPLVTHWLPLGQVGRGFELIESKAEGVGKLVIDA
jgi:L-iditol 2-dehydrogenase